MLRNHARARRALRRAIYSKEVGTLLDGATRSNLGGLRNLAMELRKVCCHPFLCDGLEQEFELRNAKLAQGGQGALLNEQERLVKSCGKMVLLHKLLPKLRKEGRK